MQHKPIVDVGCRAVIRLEGVKEGEGTQSHTPANYQQAEYQKW